jgi:hypothetical protein
MESIVCRMERDLKTEIEQAYASFWNLSKLRFCEFINDNARITTLSNVLFFPLSYRPNVL